MAEDIIEIEDAGNVEDIVKIVISVIISNSQILDMYAITRGADPVSDFYNACVAGK